MFFRNVGAVSGARILSVLAQIMVLPIISRMITTAEFGLVALAMTIVVFAQLLSDAGLGRSLVRQPTYDPDEWTSAFWLMLGVGLGLMIILMLSGPVWAYVFGLPAVADLIQVLAVIPFLQALGAVSSARLERDNRFPTLAMIRIVSLALSVVVVIMLAVNGAGAWALVMQQVVLFGGITVGTLALSAFRPSFHLSTKGLMKHVRFARDTIGTSLVFTLQRQAPTLLMGFSLGVGALGLYSMSQRVLQLPQIGLTGPASQVVFVRMARVAETPKDVGALYVHSLSLFALAIIPPMFILAALGPALFPALLSEQWADVALLFALAMPGFVLEAITSSAGVAFQAVGQTSLRFRMAFERAVLLILTVALVLPWGISAVAFSITAFMLAYTPRLWWHLHRVAPFHRGAAAWAIFCPALIAGAGWAVTTAYVLPRLSDDILLLCFAGAAVLAICFAATILVQFRNLKRSISALSAG